MTQELTFRKASPEDASFIARNVMAAIGISVYSDPFTPELFSTWSLLSSLASSEETLYSYRRTLIAEYGGVVAGSLTAYDGALYKELKVKTFALIDADIAAQIPFQDDETVPGEYYLDSLAVIPSLRHRGIARKLIWQGLSAAEGLGFAKVSLLASEDDTALQAFYRSCGFSDGDTVSCFGHKFLKMIQFIA